MAIEQNHVSDDLHFDVDDDSAVDDFDLSTGDSGVLVKQVIDPELLKVTRNGSTTRIGFQSDHMHDDVNLAAYRERVLELSEDPVCKQFEFDVSNIKILPSGMLGLMASLKKRGYEVTLLNPTADVRDVLQVMKMDTVFGIREIH